MIAHFGCRLSFFLCLFLSITYFYYFSLLSFYFLLFSLFLKVFFSVILSFFFPSFLIFYLFFIYFFPFYCYSPFSFHILGPIIWIYIKYYRHGISTFLYFTGNVTFQFYIAAKQKAMVFFFVTCMSMRILKN